MRWLLLLLFAMTPLWIVGAVAFGAATVWGQEVPPPTLDFDGDTFSDTLELHIGTEWEWACTDDPEIDVFPPDFNHDTYVDIADLVLLAGDFGKAVPDAPVRYDVNPEPAGDNLIDIGDIVRLAGFFGQTCTNLTLVVEGEAVTFTTSSSSDPPPELASVAVPGTWHTCYNRISAFNHAVSVNHRITFNTDVEGIVFWETAAWIGTSGDWYPSQQFNSYNALGFPFPPLWPHHARTDTQAYFSHPGAGGAELILTIWTDWYDNRTCRHSFTRPWWSN